MVIVLGALWYWFACWQYDGSRVSLWRFSCALYGVLYDGSGSHRGRSQNFVSIQGKYMLGNNRAYVSLEMIHALWLNNNILNGRSYYYCYLLNENGRQRLQFKLCQSH